MPFEQPRFETATVKTVIDSGLQSFMRSVYNTMALGLSFTGITAFVVANVEPLSQIIKNPIVFFIAAFAPLVFLFTGLSYKRVMGMTAAQVRSNFYLFSVIMGLSLSTIFMVYTNASIARAFFVTAATFAGMSLYGYTTKRDLSAMGSFLMMGVMGIFFASIINMFMQSAMVHFVVSVVGVLVFTGLAAWDTQRLKETYAYGHGHGDANDKLAVMGALSLYITFINLFQFMLSFMGNNRN